MNCQNVHEWLPLYMSGDVPERKSRKIGLHLEVCQECRTEFESYCSLRRHVTSLKEEPTRDALAGLYEGIRSRIEPIPCKSKHPVMRPLSFRSVSLAAALLLLSLVTLWAISAIPENHLEKRSPHATVTRMETMEVTREEINPEPYFPVSEGTMLVRERSCPRSSSSLLQLRIMAGPMVPVISVPLGPPALPATSPIPRVQPYAWRVQGSRSSSFTFH